MGRPWTRLVPRPLEISLPQGGLAHTDAFAKLNTYDVITVNSWSVGGRQLRCDGGGKKGGVQGMCTEGKCHR